MAKISESKIGLLRPEFGDANALLTQGLTSLTDSVKPFQEAMKANYATRAEQAKGQLANFIQQNMPTDYSSNPESALAFQQQLNQTYDNSNAYNEGVTSADLNTMLGARQTVNLSNESTQGANTTTNLANRATADSQLYNKIVSNVTANGGTPDDIIAAAAQYGLVVDARGNLIAADTTMAQNNAAHNAPLIQATGMLNNLDVAKGEIGRSIQGFDGSQRVLNADTQNTLRTMLSPLGGAGGKGQTLPANSLSTLGTNPGSAKYTNAINTAASQHGVPASLITAVMDTESSYDPNAKSPKGASGLMQLMPDTARSLGVQNINDPDENINAGAKYLSDMYKQFGSVETALIAYNYGPGNTQKWLDKGGKTSDLPKETQNYLTKIRNKTSGGSNTVPTTGNVNKTNKNIVYANQQAKRNQALTTKLTNVMSTVMQPLGVTMKVHSGGQSETSNGKVGSNRHDHGNAADADFYIDNGKTKLSFKNPEHRQILSTIIEEAAANGVTGIGGGEDYMGDGRLHVGFGSAATWGGKGGKGSAPEWIQAAQQRGLARASSGGSNTGGVDLSAALSGISTGLDRTNIDDTLRASLGLVDNQINNTSTLLSNLQISDRGSAGLGAIGKRSLLPQNNTGLSAITDVLNNDYKASMDFLDRGATNAESDIQNTLGGLTGNQGSLNLADEAYARAAAQSAANGGGAVPFGALFASEQDASEAKKLLKKQGITSEVLKGLAPEDQKSIINATLDYFDKKAGGATKADRETTVYKKSLVVEPKKASKVFLKDAVKAMEDDKIKTYLKWEKEETYFDRGVKQVTPFTTTVKDRRDNIRKVDTQIGQMALDVFTNNPEYQGIFKEKDLINVAKLAKSIYDTNQIERKTAESKDLYGYSDKVVNPGLMEIAIQTAFKTALPIASKNLSKRTNSGYVTPPNFDSILRGNLANSLGRKVD